LFFFCVDGKKGFGGEHGIDERAKDKSAVGFDYKPTVEKHSSQTGLEKKVLCEEKKNDEEYSFDFRFFERFWWKN
jgi:hypothetical protein